MHRARLIAVILIALAFVVLAAGIAYGALTTGRDAIAFGWGFLAVAAALVLAAVPFLVIWRHSR